MGTPRTGRLRSSAWDGTDSALSSPGSNLEGTTAIETLLVVSDIRESAYQLAMDNINTVVRIAFEVSVFIHSFANPCADYCKTS